MKTVFTTGEAAKICKVSQQTIIRCFDSGQLKGFRVPGSRFRRIPRDQLYAFMRDNGIPTDALDSGKRKILVVDDDQDLVELISDALERDGRFDIRTVNNGFGAGMLIKEFRPDLVVLDIMLPDINGKEVCNLVRSDKTMDDVRIICISGMVEQDKIQELRDAGADDFMKKPFDVDQLVNRACADNGIDKSRFPRRPRRRQARRDERAGLRRQPRDQQPAGEHRRPSPDPAPRRARP
jgi:two-component system OmpR family response regulator